MTTIVETSRWKLTSHPLYEYKDGKSSYIHRFAYNRDSSVAWAWASAYSLSYSPPVDFFRQMRAWARAVD